MSRSGYSDDDYDQWAAIRWSGALASAIRGKRGQAFLRELLAALDALPEKKLIAEELEKNGCVCALGAVGKARAIDMAPIDPEDRDRVATVFGIPYTLACQIMYENDRDNWRVITEEERFIRMRRWAEHQLIEWEQPT